MESSFHADMLLQVCNHMAFLRQRVHACEPGTVEYVQVAGLAVSETANPTEQGQKDYECFVHIHGNWFKSLAIST